MSWAGTKTPKDPKSWMNRSGQKPWYPSEHPKRLFEKGGQKPSPKEVCTPFLGFDPIPQISAEISKKNTPLRPAWSSGSVGLPRMFKGPFPLFLVNTKVVLFFFLPQGLLTLLSKLISAVAWSAHVTSQRLQRTCFCASVVGWRFFYSSRKPKISKPSTGKLTSFPI